MSDTIRTGHTPFPAGNTEEMNIKFFFGRKQDVTPEQLLEQLARADAQVREGVAKPTRVVDGDLTVVED